MKQHAYPQRDSFLSGLNRRKPKHPMLRNERRIISLPTYRMNPCYVHGNREAGPFSN